VNQQWHDEFVALCALFPSGELSEEEWALLQVHLAYCDPCRAVFRRYEQLAKKVMPVVAAIAYSDSAFEPETSSFSLDEAEQRLMSESNSRPTDRESDRRRTTKWQIPAGILAVCALAVACLIGFHFVRSKQLTASTKQPGGACMAISGAHCVTQASDPTLAPRQVPAKTLPVPTDVSPEMQKIIAAPLRAGWDVLWKTGEEQPR
jgi:hypothetical protein